VRRTLLLLVALLSVGWFGAAPAGAAGLSDTIVVKIEPATSAITLGDNLDLRIAVTNTGSQSSTPLIIHLDVTDPDRSTSVDPEDWTSTLSKPVGPVAAGDTVNVSWNIQPTSSGTFATYAVALSSGADDVVASNVLRVEVADQRTLNPNGILFVAIGAPALVAALLLLQLRLARRRRDQPKPSSE
jgi:uncharacterized membrane protein